MNAFPIRPVLDSSTHTLPLRKAVALTMETIDARARSYRNTLISCCLVGAGSLSGAAATASWKPLLGLLFLVGVAGIWLCADALAVNRWRKEILVLHVDGELDLRVLSDILSSIRSLPARTIDGMLQSVGGKDGLSGRASRATREGIRETLYAIWFMETIRPMAATGMWTLGVTVTAWSVLARSAWPFVGLGFLPVICAFGAWLKARRIRAWKRTVLRLGRRDGLDAGQFIELASQRNWQSIHSKRRNSLLASLSF